MGAIAGLPTSVLRLPTRLERDGLLKLFPALDLLRSELFAHLASEWPTNKQGPVPNTETDEDAASMARDGVSLEAIAGHFNVTKKSAAAKIKKGEDELARTNWEVWPDRPWSAPTANQWAIYVITGEAAIDALEITDPDLILAEPDPWLLRGRRAVDRVLEDGEDLRTWREEIGPLDSDRYPLAARWNRLLEPHYEALRRAIDEVLPP